MRAQPAIAALFDGECEEGIVQIAAAIAGGDFQETKSSIRGLCFIDNGGTYRHSTAPRARDIGRVDQNYGLVHNPSCHNMDIFVDPNRPLKAAQFYTQRGCPWVCGFCNKSTEDGSVARLPDESLRAQLRRLREGGYTSVISTSIHSQSTRRWLARKRRFCMRRDSFGAQTRVSVYSTFH